MHMALNLIQWVLFAAAWCLVITAMAKPRKWFNYGYNLWYIAMYAGVYEWVARCMMKRLVSHQIFFMDKSLRNSYTTS